MNVKEYKKYFSSGEYSLRYKKEITDLLFTVEYLTPEIMVCKTDLAETKSQKFLDSLSASFSNSMTFLLKVDYTEGFKLNGAKGSVLGYEIGGFTNYKERVYNLNFGLKEYLSISDGKQQIAPVLTEFEDTYDLTSDRKFIVVFSKEAIQKMEGNEVTLSFDDQFWGTGVHHYLFKKDQIENQPKLISL